MTAATAEMIGLYSIPAFLLLDLVVRNRKFDAPRFWRLQALAVSVAAFFISIPVALFWAGAIGERSAVAATLFTSFALILVIAPMLLLTGTLVDSAKVLAEDLSDGALTIPAPSAGVAGWPIIGEQVDQFFAALDAVMVQLEEVGA